MPTLVIEIEFDTKKDATKTVGTLKEVLKPLKPTIFLFEESPSYGEKPIVEF